MDKRCRHCNKRMMIAQEGRPPYTGGYWIIYGCPECGNLEYAYEDTISNLDENKMDIGYNPIKWHQDVADLRRYAVSN